MQFPKDILIIDFEGAEQPVQVGAVLLDKETFEEKQNFLSLVYADLTNDKPSKSGITQNELIGAPSRGEVGKMLYEQFGTDLFLASFVQNKDIRFFQSLLREAQIDFLASDTDFSKYDFHIIDIWPLAYVHLLKQEYTGSTKSEDIFQAFGAAPRGLHNALEDCRITADVLRKIINL